MTTLAVGSALCKRGTNTFAKNAEIGCKLTTSSGWNGTSQDLVVIVWVLLKIVGRTVLVRILPRR